MYVFGSVTVIVSVSIQPLLSVTIIVYVPTSIELRSSVTSPLDHE